MKLAKTITNPLVDMIQCFRPYWRHLDEITLNNFMDVAIDCGYVAESKSDAYVMMDILKDMGLIDIQYIDNKPCKIIKLRLL